MDNFTTIRIETGDSKYWQDRRQRAMEALADRIGIGKLSVWFDAQPDYVRGGCAMTLALAYEKKLGETMPADDECTCDDSPNRENMACRSCRARTANKSDEDLVF